MLSREKSRSKLWLYFAGVVFATICAVFLFISLLWTILYKLNYISVSPQEHRAPLFIFALGSLLLGTVIAIYVGKHIIRPVQSMGKAFDNLSKGNFAVRIPEDQQIEEIREMAQRFNAMAYDLSHIETLRSDFVANVSHEFKTPIAAIEGYATLLQTPDLSPEKHQRYIEKILENSRRLSSMSGNILLLSKLENRETLPEMSEYRLDEQIRQCILMLEGKWTQKQIEFDIDLDKKIYCGSQTLLEQVWLNILDNAIKASPIGGNIGICFKAGEETVSISVTDHGDGMTEEVQKHIFEKFYQGDPSRTSEGNGLGLALVKRIVELCRGAVTVESSRGSGTTFTVELPDGKDDFKI